MIIFVLWEINLAPKLKSSMRVDIIEILRKDFSNSWTNKAFESRNKYVSNWLLSKFRKEMQYTSNQLNNWDNQKWPIYNEKGSRRGGEKKVITVKKKKPLRQTIIGEV